MGIRFHCPNGHRLHVKSYLAGKRGICPHCGAKCRIPAQSEYTRSKQRASSHVSSGASDDPPSAGPPELEKAGDVMEPVGSVEIEVSGNETDATEPCPPGDVELGAATPITVEGPHDGSHGLVTDQPSRREPPSTDRVSMAHATAPDPIAEAPHAVWYVRPPTGGQFGPASADIMRRWITEGRVTDDSWVWREGWTDWRSARDVLRMPAAVAPVAPAVEMPQAPDVQAIVVDDSLSELRTDDRDLRAGRSSRSMTKTLALVVALGVVSIALLAGLIHVIVK